MEKYASYYWKKRTALVRAYKNIWIEEGVGWVEAEEILILSKEIEIILRMIHNIIKIIIIFIVKNSNDKEEKEVQINHEINLEEKNTYE